MTLTYYDVVACSCKCTAESGCSYMLYFRRFLLAGLVLLFSVAQVWLLGQRLVQPSPGAYPHPRPSITCFGDLHTINGTLGWVTFVTYCVGFPFILTWLALRSRYFDHEIRRNTGIGNLAIAQRSEGHLHWRIRLLINFSKTHSKNSDGVFEDSTKGKNKCCF